MMRGYGNTIFQSWAKSVLFQIFGIYVIVSLALRHHVAWIVLIVKNALLLERFFLPRKILSLARTTLLSTTKSESKGKRLFWAGSCHQPITVMVFFRRCSVKYRSNSSIPSRTVYFSSIHWRKEFQDPGRCLWKACIFVCVSKLLISTVTPTTMSHETSGLAS